jgi:hypothetical protein
MIIARARLYAILMTISAWGAIALVHSTLGATTVYAAPCCQTCEELDTVGSECDEVVHEACGGVTECYADAMNEANNCWATCHWCSYGDPSSCSICRLAEALSPPYHRFTCYGCY